MGRRALHFLFLFAAAMLVYFVGGYWSAIPTWSRTLAKVSLPVLLLVVTVLLHRRDPMHRWKPISLALLAASCGFLVSWFLSDPLLSAFGVAAETVSGIALTKLVDSVLIVVPILVVARTGGVSSSDLYLHRGRVGIWLTVGLASFGVFAALFFLQVLDKEITTRQLVAWAPWTLVFIFSNSFMEELHFRGLLLKPFEKVLGRGWANLCIALFFTLVHAPVEYTTDILSFLAIVFALSLAWGYLIQKADALWGSVLFHAGGDLMIVVGIYQTYGAHGAG